MESVLPTLLLAGLLIAAVIWCALWLHVRYWTRRLTHDVPYDSCERIATTDGSAFDLRRVPATDRHPDRPPVLIVHGLAANHRNDDLDEQHSLARHLARAGRDVWLLTLRSGRSDRTFAESRRATFSAMANHDVPDGVAAVLTRTGAENLDYIGYSMGGMLCYATLGRSVARERVRKVVIIGSPGRVGIPVWPLSKLRGPFHVLAPPFPFRVLSRLVAFIAEAFTTPIHRIPINPDNCAPGVIRRTLVNMIEDVPMALNREFARWAFSGGDIRVGGERALDGLAHVAQPVRFFAGDADSLAPPGAVRVAFEAWGGADKEMTVLAGYGHGDLAIGRQAERDLFAPIERFLAA